MNTFFLCGYVEPFGLKPLDFSLECLEIVSTLLTPRIWLLIFPSSNYTFLCEYLGEFGVKSK